MSHIIRVTTLLVALPLAFSGCGGDTAADTTDEPATSQTTEAESVEPSPTEDVVAATAPGRRYRTTYRFRLDGTPGTNTSRNTWVLEPCESDGSSCDGTGRSDTGKEFDYVWDGKVLTVRYRPFTDTGTCANSATGQVIPGSRLRLTDVSPALRLRPLGWDGESSPDRLAGPLIINRTNENVTGCERVEDAMTSGTLTATAR